MLFDLRGRGRRRTVQGIYLTLAVLMGGGLIFFGVGGNVGGGLFDALGLRGGGGGGGGNDQLSKIEQRDEKKVARNPENVAAWADLARIRYQQATAGSNYNPNTGAFTSDGKKELAKAVVAWNRYVALSPKKPDAGLAQLMLRAFATLKQYSKAAAAADIVTQVQPTATAFFTLAVLSYQAGDKRKGDLAGAKAVSLTPKAQRTAVKAQLQQAKNPQAQPTPAPSGGGAGSGSGGVPGPQPKSG